MKQEEVPEETTHADEPKVDEPAPEPEMKEKKEEVVEQEVAASTGEDQIEEKKGPRIAKTVSFFDELDTE